MIYFLWGTGLIACCHLIATNVANSHMADDSSGKSANEISAPEWIVGIFRSLGLLRLLRNRGTFRIRIFCISLAAVWIFLGTTYGVLVEEWSYLHSIYFAVGAMSAAGVPNPPCLNGDDLYPEASCQLGTVRGFALGMYIIIGVPLFAFTIGLLAGYVVEHYATLNRIRIQSSTHLNRIGPTQSPKGFAFPTNVPGASQKVGGGWSYCCTKNRSSESESDFVLAELLRRGRICGYELAEIRKIACMKCSCCAHKDSAEPTPPLPEMSVRWFRRKRFLIPLLFLVSLLGVYLLIYFGQLPQVSVANITVNATAASNITPQGISSS
jgi:hypothetical protein